MIKTKTLIVIGIIIYLAVAIISFKLVYPSLKDMQYQSNSVIK